MKTAIFAVLVVSVAFCACAKAATQAGQSSAAAMAPFEQYLMGDEKAEIALARSAAPAAVSDAAEVLVLGRQGYTTAVKGTNGFVCVVERSWGAATDEAKFWDAKIRAPICFNPAAAQTFAPIFLMKTKLVIAGKSKADIAQTVAAAFDKKELPAVGSGAMCYMLSKQQFLDEQGKNWHPHLMFFVGGDATKSWGANVTGSPIIAADDPEERVTIFMVLVTKWSDGTPGPAIEH
jgi:hypothetical protein